MKLSSRVLFTALAVALLPFGGVLQAAQDRVGYWDLHGVYHRLDAVKPHADPAHNSSSASATVLLKPVDLAAR